MRTWTNVHQSFDGHLMTVLICVVIYEIDLQPLSHIMLMILQMLNTFLLGLVYFKFV